MTRQWEHFHHQADIGVRGIGDTLEEAFEQTAIALMEVICNPKSVKPDQTVDIECRCEDIELLLVDWLNEIIFEIATRRMLFSKFEVKISGEKLTAKALGEKADPEKHETAVEVKGATYTQLEVKQNDNNKWVAQCIVDV